MKITIPETMFAIRPLKVRIRRSISSRTIFLWTIIFFWEKL